jgi:hypothetical protein
MIMYFANHCWGLKTETIIPWLITGPCKKEHLFHYLLLNPENNVTISSFFLTKLIANLYLLLVIQTLNKTNNGRLTIITNSNKIMNQLISVRHCLQATSRKQGRFSSCQDRYQELWPLTQKELETARRNRRDCLMHWLLGGEGTRWRVGWEELRGVILTLSSAVYTEC